MDGDPNSQLPQLKRRPAPWRDAFPRCLNVCLCYGQSPVEEPLPLLLDPSRVIFPCGGRRRILSHSISWFHNAPRNNRANATLTHVTLTRGFGKRKI